MTNTLAAAIRTALTGTPQDGIALDALALLDSLTQADQMGGIEHECSCTPGCS